MEASSGEVEGLEDGVLDEATASAFAASLLAYWLDGVPLGPLGVIADPVDIGASVPGVFEVSLTDTSGDGEVTDVLVRVDLTHGTFAGVPDECAPGSALSNGTALSSGTALSGGLASGADSASPADSGLSADGARLDCVLAGEDLAAGGSVRVGFTAVTSGTSVLMTTRTAAFVAVDDETGGGLAQLAEFRLPNVPVRPALNLATNLYGQWDMPAELPVAAGTPVTGWFGVDLNDLGGAAGTHDITIRLEIFYGRLVTIPDGCAPGSTISADGA
ncbi:MAG: hypothetical protein FWG11_02365, partial [Promicromonosporaceae bacterium]|nr:hypothetical protein [Promicromonosporaceae bacterium]